MNDSELPVSQTFMELVETAKHNELEEIEARRKVERKKEAELRQATGKLNASELFFSDEEQEDLKRKALVLKSIDQFNKDVADAVKQRKDQGYATSEEDAFPDPPIT